MKEQRNVTNTAISINATLKKPITFVENVFVNLASTNLYSNISGNGENGGARIT